MSPMAGLCKKRVFSRFIQEPLIAQLENKKLQTYSEQFVFLSSPDIAFPNKQLRSSMSPFDSGYSRFVKQEAVVNLKKRSATGRRGFCDLEESVGAA